jgi:hypothetical protein
MLAIVSVILGCFLLAVGLGNYKDASVLQIVVTFVFGMSFIGWGVDSIKKTQRLERVKSGSTKKSNAASKPEGSQLEKTLSTESNLDKIKKLKELLDMGVISQEEFDAKKNKLLEDI